MYIFNVFHIASAVCESRRSILLEQTLSKAELHEPMRRHRCPRTSVAISPPRGQQTPVREPNSTHRIFLYSLRV